jgi:predicted dehydrogenase
MLRIGLLGASKIAPRAVIEPARERSDVEIVAVGARDPTRARGFADEHGIGHVSDSYGALVAREDIDLVYIALPPAAHLEWTRNAVAAGKAVLCEKPFAMDGAQALAMVEAAERAGRPLIEAYHYRFHNVIRRAEALLGEGAIGPITSAKAYFSVPIAKTPGELRWIRDQGGGGLMDLGCYPLHALRTLFKSEPTVVSATGAFEDGVDVTIDAKLDFASVPAEMSCSMRPERFGARLTLTSERGQIQIVNFIGPQMGGRFTVTRDGETEELSMDGPTTYAAQLQHVVEVMDGRAAPTTGGADAIAQMDAIDAIYAAAGRPVA